MARKAKKPAFPADPAGALTRIFDGWYNSADFYAFLDLLETVLVNAHKAGVPADLDAGRFFAGSEPDPLKVRERVTAAHVREKLATAAGIVFQNAAQPLYRRTSNPEILGQAFCLLKASARLGQFFTPWSLSLMTASMVGGVVHDLDERIRSAFDKAGLQAPRGVGEHRDAFLQALPVLKGHFEPISMMEPCVGAGSMLLAFASLVPPWALAIGAVQIYGIDVDPRAIQMCRINCLLYGVPAVLHVGNALTMADLKLVPPPYGDAYSRVRQALEAGDVSEAQAVAKAAFGYAPDWDLPKPEDEERKSA